MLTGERGTVIAHMTVGPLSAFGIVVGIEHGSLADLFCGVGRGQLAWRKVCVRGRLRCSCEIVHIVISPRLIWNSRRVHSDRN
jgi:hypothetical protein